MRLTWLDMLPDPTEAGVVHVTGRCNPPMDPSRLSVMDGMVFPRAGLELLSVTLVGCIVEASFKLSSADDMDAFATPWDVSSSPAAPTRLSVTPRSLALSPSSVSDCLVAESRWLSTFQFNQAVGPLNTSLPPVTQLVKTPSGHRIMSELPNDDTVADYCRHVFDLHGVRDGTTVAFRTRVLHMDSIHVHDNKFLVPLYGMTTRFLRVHAPGKWHLRFNGQEVAQAEGAEDADGDHCAVFDLESLVPPSEERRPICSHRANGKYLGYDIVWVECDTPIDAVRVEQEGTRLVQCHMFDDVPLAGWMYV